MAEVICPVCGGPNDAGMPFCDSCGTELEQPRRPPTAPAAEPPAPREPAPAPLDTCPACGADVPDPGNSFCVECLQELHPPQAPAGGARVRLRFAAGMVVVPCGATLRLGRGSPDTGVAALLAPLDNVSRRHASVRVDSSGAAFVRDEGSANGTFVNDVRVGPEQEVPLAEGDVLRLASDVTAGVETDRDGPR